MDNVTSVSPDTVKKSKKNKEKKQIILKDRFLRNEKPDNPYVLAFLYFVVFSLSFILIFVCFFQLCAVKGDSMLNTLHDGDHVLLSRMATNFKRGDIVVLTKGEPPDEYNIIKRVIAVGGDSLRFDLGERKGTDTSGNPIYFVNGFIRKKGTEEFLPLSEKYVREDMDSTHFDGFGYKLPEDQDKEFIFGVPFDITDKFIFCMGDNRNHSADSRGGDGAYAIQCVVGKSVLHLERGSLLEKLLQFIYRERNSAG